MATQQTEAPNTDTPAPSYPRSTTQEEFRRNHGDPTGWTAVDFDVYDHLPAH